MSDDIVARLRSTGGLDAQLLCDAADAIDRLREERDHARRRVCKDAIQNGRVYRRVGSDTVRLQTPEQVAEMMGWNCFEEPEDER